MDLLSKFKSIFNEEPKEEYFSPGRVNIIGEHIDYNGGLVAPCIITQGTTALVSKRKDDKLYLFSTNFEELGVKVISLNDLEYRKEDEWTNYVKGVFYFLKQKGYSFDKGLNILISGNIPNGGLSSSASLESLILKIAKQEYNLDITNLDSILLCVKVENEFMGVSSGVMDQYSIINGKKNNLTLIDCNKLTHEYVPFNLEGKKLLILNTNKKRTLQDSKYNERFNECQKALKIFKEVLNINNLCEMSTKEFLENKHLLKDEILEKRVRHVITEQERVIDFKKALLENDWDKISRLMSESHRSLKEDYEVTGFHLDSMVEACNELGIVAARMTGAGFGGNAICIINDDELDKIDLIKEKYRQKTGIEASILIG